MSTGVYCLASLAVLPWNRQAPAATAGAVPPGPGGWAMLAWDTRQVHGFPSLYICTINPKPQPLGLPHPSLSSESNRCGHPTCLLPRTSLPSPIYLTATTTLPCSAHSAPCACRPSAPVPRHTAHPAKLPPLSPPLLTGTTTPACCVWIARSTEQVRQCLCPRQGGAEGGRGVSTRWV